MTNGRALYCFASSVSKQEAITVTWIGCNSQTNIDSTESELQLASDAM
jgi:hypothetical protein